MWTSSCVCSEVGRGCRWIKAVSDWPAVRVTIWGCQWHLESAVQALVGCAGLVMYCVTSAALSLVICLLSLPCSGYLGISLCACEWEWFISVAAGIGSQKFKAVLAQTIHKASSSTPTWHECMELVFKLNYQVQQLELYVNKYAYFLLCSAQGNMSKRCKGGLGPGRLQSVWRAPLLEGLGCEPVACLLLCGSSFNVGTPIKE